MKKFITINGKNCWITERKYLGDAIISSQNICDHSKEIIVREIDTITDYTKVYVNQSQDIHCSECDKVMDDMCHNYGTETIHVCIHCYNDAQQNQYT